jgi:hypothetical protein
LPEKVLPTALVTPLGIQKNKDNAVSRTEQEQRRKN